MLVATFNWTTRWVGKKITSENERFMLEGRGRVSPKNIMKYDEKGQLVWTNEGMRAWVVARAQSASSQSSAPKSSSEIAIFGPGAKWAGSAVYRHGDRFLVEGLGRISAATLVEHDRLGNLLWASDEEHRSVGSLAEPASAQTPSQPSVPQRSELMATFGPRSSWAGRTITREGDVFMLDSHQRISAPAMMEYDRQGHLVWAKDEARAWVQAQARTVTPKAFIEEIQPAMTSAVDCPQHMSQLARKVYDAHEGSPQFDFVIVGGGDQCLVALRDSCAIIKPTVWTLKKGFARFSYSEITSLSLHDVGHALALQIATPSHPASELGSSFGTLPERTANCLPGVGGGEALNVGTAVEIHELRRRAGLQQPQRDIIAWVPCCRVFSQAGIVLSKEITHDLVFCEDRLIFQQSVDGRREATIPYSDVVVLEVYGTTAAGNRAAALAGDTITAALTGVHSLMTLQTTTVELYLLNTWAYEPAVRLCLSPVFNRLRQRRTAPVGAAREKALSGDVLADRLTRITNWHAQGMLTDEEFAALRAKLRGW